MDSAAHNWSSEEYAPTNFKIESLMKATNRYTPPIDLEAYFAEK